MLRMRLIRISVTVSIAALALAVGTANAAKSPTLSYGLAKNAIQKKADAFAGTRTKITSMFHTTPLSYSGRAEWDKTDPVGCVGCGYDPITGSFYDTPKTESCSISVVATRKLSGRIAVRTEDFACY